MLEYQKDFISNALQWDVLKFGSFQLKSGRTSPYFFNTGLVDTGAKLAKLGHFYARALMHSGVKPGMLYGPAYKGIPLAIATASAYAAASGSDMPFAFNRKEAKDHGEGGLIVGAELKGSVMIVDDVITAGTSVKESVQIIRQAGATPCGVLIALDRQEKAESGVSAVQEVVDCYKIPVISIIGLADIISYVEGSNNAHLAEIHAYRERYGV